MKAQKIDTYQMFIILVRFLKFAYFLDFDSLQILF